MSKIEAIISRKRSTSPSQLSSAKRSTSTSSSLLAKNGSTIPSPDPLILRQQYSTNSPVIAALNFHRPSASPTASGPAIGEEGQQCAPLNFATGIPRPAPANQRTAPVHIDVGGMNYTTTLETLTKYPDSRLAKLFNGTIPVVLDSLKQAYFLDRDGPSFRHILNFLRSGDLALPEDFQALDILETEARYYELDEMMESIDQLRQRRATSNCVTKPNLLRPTRTDVILVHLERDDPSDVSNSSEDHPNPKHSKLSTPANGEKLYLTGSVDILKDLFPEFVSTQNHQPKHKFSSTKTNMNTNETTSCDHYVERARLAKPVPATEALRRFAEQDFTVFSTSVLHWPDQRRHTIEYALLSKR